MERIGLNESMTLCFALLDNGYQPEAAKDPEAWNRKFEIPAKNGVPIDPKDTWEVMDEKNKGWMWIKHPVYGWCPDPGRRALCDEIRKLIGNEAFNAKFGEEDIMNGKMPHLQFSHEGWIQQWLLCKAEIDKQKNDKPNQMAPAVGGSESATGEGV